MWKRTQHWQNDSSSLNPLLKRYSHVWFVANFPSAGSSFASSNCHRRSRLGLLSDYRTEVAARTSSGVVLHGATERICQRTCAYLAGGLSISRARVRYATYIDRTRRRRTTSCRRATRWEIANDTDSLYGCSLARCDSSEHSWDIDQMGHQI